MPKHGRHDEGVQIRSRAVPTRAEIWEQRPIGGATLAVTRGVYSCNYSADAGRGSTTFQAVIGARRWRAALLGTAAAGALWVAAPRAAKAGPDACTQAGGVATCSGDQSAGIASGVNFPADSTVLNVNNVDGDIAPAAGTDGIYFSGTSTVEINSDTGLYAIITQGAYADGIEAIGLNGVVIDHTGDIGSQGGDGIAVDSDYDTVTVTSDGTINAYNTGIVAEGYDDVSVDHTGDIASQNGNGIYGTSAIGIVDITSEGTIDTYNSGIRVYGDFDVTIAHTGDITSQDASGIVADSNYNGAVTVTSAGTIDADFNGIDADGELDVTVTHTGDITAQNFNGIYAISFSDVVDITSEGNIDAGFNGIYGYGYDGAVVDHTGDITAQDGSGIVAASYAGAVAVTNAGTIAAGGYAGIFAVGASDVSVAPTGDVTAQNGFGIRADSANGAVTITSAGTIDAFDDGIIAYGASGVTIDHSGDITAPDGFGIRARSSGGAITVSSGGTIAAFYDGIVANGESDVTIAHTGDITAQEGNGINASSTSGPVTITSDGTIDAFNEGIGARAYSDTVTITHTGNITTQNGEGIFANARAVTITSDGTIEADYIGIFATSGGAITITHAGDITAQRAEGIFATSGGTVTIANDGAIDSVLTGIRAEGDADVTIIHTGDITAQVYGGIYARSYTGAVTISSAGAIDTGIYGGGVYALAETNASIAHTGDITTQDGNGIFARSTTGAVTITSNGTIDADFTGIAAGGADGVTIAHAGDIISRDAEGIFAFSSGGAITSTSAGTINASLDGIRAEADGDVTIAHIGDITAQDRFGINASSLTGPIAVALAGGTVSGAAAGVQFNDGADNLLTNAGTVTGGAQAILGGAGNETVYNFGTVTGNIDLGGGSNTFNNLAGGLFEPDNTVFLGAGSVLANAGALSPGADTITTTLLTGNLTQTATGTFAVDVDMAAGTADRLDVTGTATLAGEVLPSVTNLQSGVQAFTILTAGGGVTDNGITVEDTVAVDFDLDFPAPDQMDLIADVNFAPLGLTSNQATMGQSLNDLFAAGDGGPMPLSAEPFAATTAMDTTARELTPLFDQLAAIPDFDTFADVLDRLHPEPYLALPYTTVFSGLAFTDGMMSCPLPGAAGTAAADGGAVDLKDSSAWFAPAEGAANRFIAEGQCVWLRGAGRALDRDPGPAMIGVDEEAGGLSGGVQWALGPYWRAGLAVGYEHSSIDVDDRLEAGGDILHVGGVVKYIRDNWLVSGALSGGIANYDTMRAIGLPGLPSTATADADMSFIAGRLRGAYVFDFEPWYVKPMVDVDVVSIDRDEIREIGAGPLSLAVEGETDTFVSLAPALEVGGELIAADGGLLRPFARVGVRFFDTDDIGATAAFAGTPAGEAPFAVTTPFDDVFAEISAGLDIFDISGIELRIAYEGRFAEDTQQHGGSLKLSTRF